MKTVSALVLAALLPGSANAQPPQSANGNPILAMGAYVPSDDLGVSETFYRALFDAAPVIELTDFVAFNVAGGWFAIVSRERYAPGSEPGTGAVPFLQSGNLEMLRDRVMSNGGDAPDIIEEPGISLLKITDPNGQVIEFFAFTDQ